LALHYTREYSDVPEKELKILLKESNFNVKIIAPKELAGLERYIVGKTRVAEPRWDGSEMSDLKRCRLHKTCCCIYC